MALDWWEFTAVIRSRIILSTLSELVRDRKCKVTKGIPYHSETERLKLDYYEPLTGGSEMPVAIFLYGGGWNSGEREFYSFVGCALASHGIRTVIPDYRLYPEVVFPTFVDDSALAYQWVVDNVCGSMPGGPMIVGHSAGAHIGALLCYSHHYLANSKNSKSSPSGFVGISGPYDFDLTSWPSTRPIFSSTSPSELTRPTMQVSKTSQVPALIVHGAEDHVINIEEAISMNRAINDSGARSSLLVLKDRGHVDTVLLFSKLSRGNNMLLNEIIKFQRLIQ